MLTSIPLRYRVAAALCAFAVPALGVVLWLAYAAVLDSHRSDAAGNELNALILLSALGKVALVDDRLAEVETQLHELADSRDILQVIISDDRDHAVAVALRSPAHPPPGPAPDGPSHWAAREIREGNRTIGRVSVRFSDARLMQRRHRADQLLLMGSLLGLMAVGASSWWAGGSLTRRLTALHQVADRIAKGDFAARAGLRGSDEVSHIARVLDRLAHELYRYSDALGEGQQRLELFIRGSNEGFWDWEVKAGRFYLSPRLREMLGYSDAEAPVGLLETWLRHVHPDDRERVKQEMQAALDAATPFQSEFRLVTRQGDPLWVQSRGNALHDRRKERHMAGSCTDITERKRAALYLEETLMRLRALIEALPDAVVFKDPDGRWQLVNSAAAELFRLQDVQWAGKTDLELAPQQSDLARFFHCAQQGDERAWTTGLRDDSEDVLTGPGGEARFLHLTRVPLLDGEGTRQGLIVVARDLTERRRAEDALFREKERAEVTLQSIGDGVITTDTEARIEYLNPVAEQLTGWARAAAQGRMLTEVLNILDEDTGQTIGNPAEMALSVGGPVTWSERTALVRADGGETQVICTAAPIRDRQGCTVGVVIGFQDTSKMRALENQLTYQATHDALTGLINRYEFERRLQRATGAHGDSSHVLCYLDLDQFKLVNDTCGHNAGDALLREIAELFRSRVRHTDTLARLGGDEFALLLEDCSVEQAMAVADKLLQAINGLRFEYRGTVFSVGVSIGLARIPPGSRDAAQILSAADEACSIAKDKGRSRIYVYHANEAESARWHSDMTWAGRLQHILEQGRFVLFAQPIVPIRQPPAQHTHYEVLLRAKDEQGRLIMPGQFLPAAERYRMMNKLDRWVVRNSIEALATARQSGRARGIETLAINLAGASLSDEGFLEFIRTTLEEHGLLPSLLCFEITETVAIADFAHALRFIDELKQLGCRFSLDDFGSGFSSFSYLKSLPVDYLKIDGSFIRHVAINRMDESMVEAINHIGHVIGVKTVAEFVEDQATLDKLDQLGVDYAQGYFFAKPRPFYEVCYV